jgi:S1-C subfamily serine protease
MSTDNRYPPSRSSTSPAFWMFLLLLGLVVFLVWRLWPARDGDPAGPAARQVTPRGNLSEAEKSTIELFEKASASVVNITSVNLLRDRFSLSVQEYPTGAGSGFVWDKKGHIITNYHVIDKADVIVVTLADRSTWKTSKRRAVWDKDRDLAVLRIDAPAEKLHPIEVGESNNLKVGQSAFAIGNPFGLDHTLTQGVVSALGRDLANLKGLIQTDAAINPGNSGGPLLDSYARLIGVNTAIVSPSGSSAGIGFAIPVDEVNRVVAHLTSGPQKKSRPALGIEVVPDQLARKWGVPGVLVLNVLPDGPAARAGLRAMRRDEEGNIYLGDAILAINGKATAATKQLFSILEQFRPGDEVTLTVLREGERVDVTLTLGEGIR